MIRISADWRFSIPVDFSKRDHFINRELSWLEFNQRVLDQAFDASNPLLERLKFLAIVSSNLDEFFEVRVAGLKQQKQNNSSEVGPDGLSATEALARISKRTRRMVEDQYRCWREQVYPQLHEQGVRFHNYPDVPPEERAHFEKFFRETIYPVLTPLAVDPAHPFPQLLNKSLNVIVELEGEGISTDIAVVQAPRILPRVVPFSKSPDGNDYVFLGNIIQEHVDSLFHGVHVKGSHLFRVTRNSNLYVDEEESSNLLHAIEEELRKVKRGAIAGKYGVLVDALYAGRAEQYIETAVTFEDGRSGSVSATLKIADAKTFAAVRKAA